MNKITTYLREVREELKKVEWPKRQEAVKLTATVVIITAIVGIYVGALDYVFARIIELIISG